MSSVYDFEDDVLQSRETVNSGLESKALRRYELVKERMGFVWWSLRRKEDRVYLILDGVDLDMKTKEFGIDNMLGHIVDLKKEDYLCVEFVGSYMENKVTMAVSDFCASANEFSRDIGHPKSTSDFCQRVKEKLNNDESDENEENELESTLETTLNDTTEDMEDDNYDKTSSKENENNMVSPNVYAEEARQRYIGEFDIPLSAINFASESKAIRQLNAQHLAELYTSFHSNLNNGMTLNFPPATAVAKTEDPFRRDAEVELIDGNHTHHVMLQLKELYPEREELKTRKVFLYEKLSPGAMSFLGLSRNDETSNSLRTSQFEELTIMRNVLQRKYGGIFSAAFQDDVYQLFNAVCPNDRTEETKRKKRLQHHIRLSTMRQSCWDQMDNIIKKHPGTSIFAFRELSRLEVSQASSLLQRVIDEGLSIAKMKKILKDCPSPPPETTLFALQRIRGKANKERKRKGTPNAPSSSIPPKVSAIEEADNSRDYKEVEKIELNKHKQLQQDIEEKRKVKNTLERDIEEKRKEKENLNREVLATRKEKNDLEQEMELLKMDIRKIHKEKRSLEEEVEALKTLTCRQPEKSMPFSTPSTLSEGSKLHPAFVTAYTPEEKVVTAAVVEYTNRRVYMGALEEEKLTYCKTPLGKIEENFNITKINANSITLNKKDIQKFSKTEKKFLILTFLCPIRDLKLIVDDEKCQLITKKVLEYFRKS
ncbi:uncharacterized protein [Magallana gigas]|uniref:uncharacterized protein isoform X2 n=1 Tax=Magallana gigas TaxID=29159 RepID=UPI00334124C9